MALWEELEEYLFDREALGEMFNTHALAADWKVPVRDAQRYIASYQRAQRSPKSKTLFVLYRQAGTRTSSTMWCVGTHASDARAVGAQAADDFKHRVDTFTRPVLERIGVLNPRAIPAAKAAVHGLEASIEMLVALLDGDA